MRSTVSKIVAVTLAICLLASATFANPGNREERMANRDAQFCDSGKHDNHRRCAE